MAKKYISKIVKNGYTIYMKDAEAQAAIKPYASEADCRAIVTGYGLNNS